MLIADMIFFCRISWKKLNFDLTPDLKKDIKCSNWVIFISQDDNFSRKKIHLASTISGVESQLALFACFASQTNAVLLFYFYLNEIRRSGSISVSDPFSEVLHYEHIRSNGVTYFFGVSRIEWKARKVYSKGPLCKTAESFDTYRFQSWQMATKTCIFRFRMLFLHNRIRH